MESSYALLLESEKNAKSSYILKMFAKKGINVNFLRALDHAILNMQKVCILNNLMCTGKSSIYGCPNYNMNLQLLWKKYQL